MVVAWVVIGLLSGLWMARRGYDPLWTLIALPLGPLFVPIAVERVQRRPGAAGHLGNTPPDRTPSDAAPRVLVGLDGSQESERVLATVLRMLGPNCGLLVLATVVHYEAVDDDTGADVDAARQWLVQMAAQADRVGTVHTEVLAGAPSVALRQYAAQHDIDLLVVGRRGRGLSARILGSVSAELVEHSSVPVLVVEPVQKAVARTDSEQPSTEVPRRL